MKVCRSRGCVFRIQDVYAVKNCHVGNCVFKYVDRHRCCVLGRFVSIAREVVVDYAVDAAEVESLNLWLEHELEIAGGSE